MQSEDEEKKMKCECCGGESDGGLNVFSRHPLDGDDGEILLQFPDGSGMGLDPVDAIGLAMDILGAARDVMTLDVADVEVDESCYDA